MSNNKIILGTVQFGLKYGINNTSVKPDFNEIEKILNFAYSNGICMLDTAETYGTAQIEIGKYHKKTNNKFKVITKYSSKKSNLDQNIEKRVVNNIKELENTDVIIWTTTPWTIPANKALAYNEALDYLIIELGDEGDFKNKKIVVAEALLESVIKDCEIKIYKENKN